MLINCEGRNKGAAQIWGLRNWIPILMKMLRIGRRHRNSYEVESLPSDLP